VLGRAQTPGFGINKREGSNRGDKKEYRDETAFGELVLECGVKRGGKKGALSEREPAACDSRQGKRKREGEERVEG